MLQAVTAPPSSGQWFALPRCCSLTGQGPGPRNCARARTHTHTHERTRGLEVCAKKVMTNSPEFKSCFIFRVEVGQINADIFLPTRIP